MPEAIELKQQVQKIFWFNQKLVKHKENGDIEFAPIYFNSVTKTTINSKYMVDNLYRNFVQNR